MRPSEEEIIADIEKRIANGTDLDGLIPVKARVPRNPRAVFSIRLSQDELKAISASAEKRGASLGDFIREAALNEARRERIGAGEDLSLEALKEDLDSLRRKLEQKLAQEAKEKKSA